MSSFPAPSLKRRRSRSPSLDVIRQKRTTPRPDKKKLKLMTSTVLGHPASRRRHRLARLLQKQMIHVAGLNESTVPVADNNNNLSIPFVAPFEGPRLESNSVELVGPTNFAPDDSIIPSLSPPPGENGIEEQSGKAGWLQRVEGSQLSDRDLDATIKSVLLPLHEPGSIRLSAPNHPTLASKGASTGSYDFKSGDQVYLTSSTQDQPAGQVPAASSSYVDSETWEQMQCSSVTAPKSQVHSLSRLPERSCEPSIGKRVGNLVPPSVELQSSAHRTPRSVVRWSPYVRTCHIRKVSNSFPLLSSHELDARAPDILSEAGLDSDNVSNDRNEYESDEDPAPSATQVTSLDVQFLSEKAAGKQRAEDAATESFRGPLLINCESLTGLNNAVLPGQRTGEDMGGNFIEETPLSGKTPSEGEVRDTGTSESPTRQLHDFGIHENAVMDTEAPGNRAEKSHNSMHMKLDADGIYDNLLRHPDSLCTNAPVALLCELLVDLKSTITSLHRCSCSGPTVINEESDMPSEISESKRGSRLHTVRRSAPVANRNQDKKRQPSYLVNLKADIRRLMHEFLEYPEKDLTAPGLAQLKQYKEKNPAAAGPSLKPLVLDLASKGTSSWNKKAARLFRETFQSLDISECDDEALIEAMFLTHVDYLRKLYLKQSFNVEETVEAAERAKCKARYARRKELRERRFKNALVPYEHIPQMKAIRATVSTFPAEVVSEDEREVVNDQQHYLVVRLDWRSSDGNAICEILDALHMASHFTTTDQPRPGRFNHPRTHSNRLFTGSAPPALPVNMYKPEYLNGLSSDELQELNVQPKVDFLFPSRVMRIAARFRHVKWRGDLPLPRNDLSLNVYAEGHMYTAFVE